MLFKPVVVLPPSPVLSPCEVSELPSQSLFQRDILKDRKSTIQMLSPRKVKQNIQTICTK